MMTKLYVNDEITLFDGKFYFFKFLVIKTLDPDWIRIGFQPKMLDPDPCPMNTDPKPC